MHYVFVYWFLINKLVWNFKHNWQTSINIIKSSAVHDDMATLVSSFVYRCSAALE